MNLRGITYVQGRGVLPPRVGSLAVLAGVAELAGLPGLFWSGSASVTCWFRLRCLRRRRHWLPPTPTPTPTLTPMLTSTLMPTYCLMTKMCLQIVYLLCLQPRHLLLRQARHLSSPRTFQLHCQRGHTAAVFARPFGCLGRFVGDYTWLFR